MEEPMTDDVRSYFEALEAEWNALVAERDQLHERIGKAEGVAEGLVEDRDRHVATIASMEEEHVAARDELGERIEGLKTDLEQAWTDGERQRVRLAEELNELAAERDSIAADLAKVAG